MWIQIKNTIINLRCAAPFPGHVVQGYILKVSDIGPIISPELHIPLLFMLWIPTLIYALSSFSSVLQPRNTIQINLFFP